MTDSTLDNLTAFLQGRTTYHRNRKDSTTDQNDWHLNHGVLQGLNIALEAIEAAKKGQL